MKFTLRRTALATLTAVAVASGLTACAGNSNDGDVIRVGTTDQSQEQWQVFEKEAEAAGLKVDLVGFNDYNLPNRALQDGQIDVNNFQHLMFLGQYNVKNNSNLTPIGATEIVPLALYYKDHTKVEDIANAGEVVIPNDSTNQGRAINVLVSAGLVKLKDAGLLMPTPADIDTGASKVKVTPVDAAQTATSYLDGTPAVINNSFLDRAGIDPKSAIFQDDPTSPAAQPYINAFVTSPERKDDEKLLELVKIWHSPKVQEAIDRQSRGTSVSVTMGGPELEKILTKVEDEIKAQ